MKKVFLSIVILTAIAATTSSCEKCTVCTGSEIDGDLITEYCGNELDVRQFESFFLDSLANLTPPVGGYCERGPDE